MSDWRPIETAPKDGTIIDIGGRAFDGVFERWCNAHWEDRGGEEGTWRGPWSDGYESELPDDRFVPTHWMPLPAPPSPTHE